ncbi:MAG: Holliday junction branch migration protein RuvA [Deltaproteobacteria bacterium]|nr:Holliday junction branch migration protein RuvA [Deltaproteobacteria bacterium]
MIARIEGKLIEKSPESIIVDVMGIGYEIFVSLSTYYNLPDVENKVILYIFTQVREDFIHFYGFLTKEEKEVFKKLITVSGIGPKVAINLLSGISPQEFTDAVINQDVARIMAIPGIGKKTAERIIIELKDKKWEIPWESSSEALLLTNKNKAIIKDMISALKNLGYKKRDIEFVIAKLSKKLDENVTLETLLKEALSLLSKNMRH